MNRINLIDALLAKEICKDFEISGATCEELTKLENAADAKFPAAYKEFLYGIGHGAGKFLQGTDIFIGALDGLMQEAKSLLVEDEAGVTLGEDAFVFSMHQGYEFLYFFLNEGDDPPVYQYVEGIGMPMPAWKSFSDFLKDMIAQHSEN